jgi:hypothetical protein
VCFAYRVFHHSSLALVREMEESTHNAELSNFKLKPVAKSPPSKAPPPPTVYVPQMKKSALPPLLVSEGFQPGGSAIVDAQKPVAKPVAKPGAKPAGKVAAKPGAKPAAKPAATTAPKTESPESQAKDSGIDERVQPEPQGATDQTQIEDKKPDTKTEHKPDHAEQPTIAAGATPTESHTEVPAGVAVFDPLLSTLAEGEKKEATTTVESSAGTAVYDVATSSVTESTPTPTKPTEIPPQEPQQPTDSLPHPATTEETKDNDSDGSYDDDSGSDSGGDLVYTTSKLQVQLRNVQVEFQKDMRTRDNRIKEMKRWRTSNALPHADELKPILSREEALKAALFIEDSDVDAREKYGREPSLYHFVCLGFVVVFMLLFD